MIASFYETHVYPDSSFPFLYHPVVLHDQFQFLLHWHENIELLFVTSGSLKITLDAKQYLAQAGELVVINSNCVHFAQNDSSVCQYACLITDLRFCESFGLPASTLQIQPVVSSPVVQQLFYKIIEEFQTERAYQKQILKSTIMMLMSELFRNHLLSADSREPTQNTHRLEVIQSAILFMRQHAGEPISTEDIAKELGFSKYYFCRIFKEMTMYSPVYYLNLLRCKNAQQMLTEGIDAIHQIAVLCGFENMSYFTRTYKKYMGILPSEEKRLAQCQPEENIGNTVLSKTDIYHEAIKRQKGKASAREK